MSLQSTYQVYAKEAVFHDPIGIAEGVESIRAQFNGLAKASIKPEYRRMPLDERYHQRVSTALSARGHPTLPRIGEPIVGAQEHSSVPRGADEPAGVCPFDLVAGCVDAERSGQAVSEGRSKGKGLTRMTM